jgi:hypothetical protein
MWDGTKQELFLSQDKVKLLEQKIVFKDSIISNLNTQIVNYKSIMDTRSGQLTLSQELSGRLQRDLKKEQVKGKMVAGTGILGILAVFSLHLVNGSKIQAKSSNSDSARSGAVSLLIIDEAAFIDNIAETWASAQQTLSTGGGAIVLSTPYGTGTGLIKPGLKQNVVKTILFLLNYLGIFILNEIQNGERDKMNY